LDEIYATLVVRLHHTEPFQQDQLWRYAADFKTNTGRQLGVKLTRRAPGVGELDVYFDPAVAMDEKITNRQIREIRERKKELHFVFRPVSFFAWFACFAVAVFQIESTDDAHKATGAKLYLQLKSGNYQLHPLVVSFIADAVLFVAAPFRHDGLGAASGASRRVVKRVRLGFMVISWFWVAGFTFPFPARRFRDSGV